MSIMCETCKCTISSEGGCSNGCPCCNDPSAEVIWQAEITRGMVADWTDDEIDLLCADLNDAVQGTYEEWEVN
jgi:hypothetical protein